MRILSRMNKFSWGNAVVELVLITIGILMAIQIDNWKDTHKEKQLEKKLLKELKISLEQDLEFLSKKIIPRVQIAIGSSEYLLNQIYYKTNSSDSVQIHLQNLTFGIEFEPRTSAFENLKSTGINLISNDNLRLKIVELYDFEYQRTFRIIENIINIYRQAHLVPYLINDLEYRISVNNDREFLTQLYVSEETIHDQEFVNFVSSRYINFKDTYNWLVRTEKQISMLLEELERELNGTV